MKKSTLMIIALFVSGVSFGQESPRKQAEGVVGKVSIIVDYGSPSVRGRTVWGGLEPYGKVWRAGANQNTTVSFDKAVKVGGNVLPAGKYGFFIIPNEKSDWVVIFNKRNADWGAFSYDINEDALRLKIKPQFVKENQETLKYSVDNQGIVFAWEKVRLTIPLSE
jgi:hypothetical protein